MLSDFSDNIVDVSWSPDGKRLGMLGYTHDTSNNRIQETLIIWNSTTWKEIEQRPDVTAFAWSPNGQQIALAVASTDYSQERDIRIVDAATGSTLKLIAEGSSIGKIAWSPDGTCLASENAVNSDIQLWNVANGQLRYSFTEAPAYQPSWSPDSRYIVSLRTFAPNPQFPIGKVEIIVWAAR
ncbi:hypothetical protein EPA93_07955 [Ktedonosporobacter rubrisoli]|uniref:Translation initiation factor beta propellor-like domain-containing protein n=1 Tax=Ktedonosporobacter rubrisoli TaxID=2509675 RepID=A0A4P6JMN3_KTERU|nr:PD40 domain-containing protein [Ktedonosporobacter rubrisoli]QBD75946.1 hypothetical protein EPA93_07955 [Ktedonosporobacter rubrisoli]